MKTVIMAGGRGTRIASLFPDIPKPLVPIDDRNGVSKPVIEWIIESLVSQGFCDIIMTVNYMADKIQECLGDGRKYGCKIEYYIEETPLGNAGALFFLRDKLKEEFFLLNADAIFDVDFNRMLEYHHKHNALVTIFTHPNSHPYDSGLIITGENGEVEQWLTKEDNRPSYYKNRVNAGLHVVDPSVLDIVTSKLELNNEQNNNSECVVKIDLDRQVLKPLCGTGKMYAYDSPEYVKDMGTPERFDSVRRDFKEGIITAKNLSHPQKAIFLDRDGTINVYKGFVRDVDDFVLDDGVAEAIKLINESGFLAIVITNQPVIARGEVSTEELRYIHNKMETELGKFGSYVDGLYYCPHHPDRGYIGEIPELKIDCSCRKPKPGMILEAASDYNIDLSASWMIGDGKNDVIAGKAAGCHTAHIGAEDCGADFNASNLLEAVKKILDI